MRLPVGQWRGVGLTSTNHRTIVLGSGDNKFAVVLDVCNLGLDPQGHLA